MPVPVVAGLASAGKAILAAGGLTAGASVANSILQNRANKRENELAYQRRQDEIRKMNEYNSPASQVLRLRAAGLSPGLAYGGAGTVTGDQSQIADPIPTQYSAANFSNGSAIIESMINAREQINKNDLTESDLKMKFAQTASEYLMQSKTKAETDYILNKIQLDSEVCLATADKLREEKWFIKANTSLTNDQRIKVQKEWRLTDEQIKQTAASRGFTEFQLYRALTILGPELRQMDSTIAMQYANAGYFNQQVKYLAGMLELNQESNERSWMNYHLDVYKAGKSLYYQGRHVFNESQNIENNYLINSRRNEILQGALDLRGREFQHQKTMDYLNFGLNTYKFLNDKDFKREVHADETALNSLRLLTTCIELLPAAM